MMHKIEPDVMVVSPVAYVLMDYPPELPLGLMLSRGLAHVLESLEGHPELYQIAAQRDGQVLIMGFQADEYVELVEGQGLASSESSVVPYAELRDDPHSAYLLFDGVVDGAPHLFALCSAYARREVSLGQTVAGLTVLSAAHAQDDDGHGPERAMLA